MRSPTLRLTHFSAQPGESQRQTSSPDLRVLRCWKEYPFRLSLFLPLREGTKKASTGDVGASASAAVAGAADGCCAAAMNRNRSRILALSRDTIPHWQWSQSTDQILGASQEMSGIEHDDKSNMLSCKKEDKRHLIQGSMSCSMFSSPGMMSFIQI